MLNGLEDEELQCVTERGAAESQYKRSIQKTLCENTTTRHASHLLRISDNFYIFINSLELSRKSDVAQKSRNILDYYYY